MLQTAEELHKYLTDLDIQYVTRSHPEVFTVETMMIHVHDMPGIHTKNLFLKDKKKNLYLLSARHDQPIKLQEIGKRLGTKELRLASEDVLYEKLGVRQGCVTLFAVINDTEGHVRVLLDSALLKQDCPYVNFHPLSNSATTGISPQDLQKFLQQTKHDPVVVNIE